MTYIKNLLEPRSVKSSRNIRLFQQPAGHRITKRDEACDIACPRCHSRKVPGFDSRECPCRRGLQSAEHLLIECRLHTQKRSRTWEKDRRKVAFGRMIWEEMLTSPKFAKKAAQFMKSLGLIDQFRSATIE